MSLPDTSSLRALILLSRLGSITETASAMGRTHSAVSRKIKSLENHLGFALTIPAGRGLRLSPRALAYVSDIAPLLDLLEVAGQRGSDVGGGLTINVAPGFAASWLANHLISFQNLHPGIDLRLTSPQAYGDLSDETSDLHITFALPSEVRTSATALFSVSFFPVLSPALLPRIEPDAPSSLTRLPFLHLNDATDWRDWLGQATGSAVLAPPGVTFSDMHIMLAAAMAGQGVALGDSLTAQSALARGDLVAPYAARLTSQRRYYLVQKSAQPSPQAKAFATWITAALRDSGERV